MMSLIKYYSMQRFWIGFIVFLLIQSCNSPSEPHGIKIDNALSFQTSGYVRDIALNDSTLAVAADQGGYIVYKIIQDNNGSIIGLDTLNFSNETTSNGMDDASFEVDLSNDGKIAFFMDPFDIVNLAPAIENLDVDPPNMEMYSSWNLYRSIAIGRSDSNYVVHSLLRHVSAEGSSQYEPYSSSIVTQVCENYLALYGMDDVALGCSESTIINDLSYYCSKISYNDPYLTVANDQLGVIIYNQNNSNGLDFFSQYDAPSSVVSVYSDGNIIFSGLANDKGCYIALLDDNGSIISNLSIADGYSIYDIDVYENIVALASKSDGVLLYEFDQELNFKEIGNISTGYAYTAKFYDNNTIFIGTRDGFQIINFGE